MSGFVVSEFAEVGSIQKLGYSCREINYSQHGSGLPSTAKIHKNLPEKRSERQAISAKVGQPLTIRPVRRRRSNNEHYFELG